MKKIYIFNLYFIETILCQVILCRTLLFEIHKLRELARIKLLDLIKA